MHLAFSASNGFFSGYLEYFWNARHLKEIGMALKSFPNKVPDDYLFELGSKMPDSNYAYYFALHAYTLGQTGYCALQIVIDNKQDSPEAGECRFSIAAEPSAINRLGKLLLTFSELKHQSMIWSLSGEDDCLIENQKS